MSKKLEGKVAVITGGNSGIGLATARRFVAEGAHVFITGRRQAELDEAVRQIGRNVTGVQGDVSNLADLDRLFGTVKQQQGRLDVLFANAGVLAVAPLGLITEEDFAKVFNVNVKGLLFTVQVALPLFTAAGRSSSTPRSLRPKRWKLEASTAPARQRCGRSLGAGPPS
jgi:NAD(P)-dependent dehydrogenase (short-subunit alcohol dehydrogenase family)